MSEPCPTCRGSGVTSAAGPPGSRRFGVSCFNKYFQDKSAGIDVEMLATDVLDMGPLAIGRDSQFWEYRDGVWRMSRKVVRNRCVTLLGSRYRQSHATNCEDVVSARVPEIGCDPVPDYFNCRNGSSGISARHSRF